MADHLERRGAGSDDHARLQRDGRHAAREEHVADGLAAREVLRELRGVGVEAAEVHDAAHARGLRGGRDVLGGGALRRREVALGSHAVHEVVEDVDAVDRGPERRGVGEVAAHHLHVVATGHVGEAPGIPHEHAHAEAGLEETGHEPTADVARRSGHEGETGGGARRCHSLTLGNQPGKRLPGAGTGGGRRPRISPRRTRARRGTGARWGRALPRTSTSRRGGRGRGPRAGRGAGASWP